MVQAIITLDEKTDRIINIVKGQHGLKNKSAAIGMIVARYEESLLEVKPSFAASLERTRKGAYHKRTPENLRKSLR
jgi:hypothetical protein